MHMPDGFIDGTTSLAGAAVAITGLTVCVRKASQTLDDKQVPLAGLTAAFVFAAQMLNFPVASGTSGHLLGGVLAAVLVGPWVGTLCVTVVLTVQALLFADGGLSALGLNVVNMAMVGAFGGYAVFLLVRRVLPRTRPNVTLASGLAAACGPVLAAIAFTFEYAVGGNGAASVATVGSAVIGVHVLIGIGEGIITAMTVGAVDVEPSGPRVGSEEPPPRAPTCARGGAHMNRRTWTFVGVGLVVAFALAFFVSPYASSQPDGLEKVAAEEGVDAEARAHALERGPLADYGVEGVDDAKLSTGVAGIIGVTTTFALGYGALLLVRAVRKREPATP